MKKNRLGRLLICAILVLLFSLPTFSQDFFPDPGILYDISSVARVDITIDQTDLEYILDPENEQSDIEFMATFKFTRGSFSETIDSVGFRLRGNTSRGSAKKSFKVSLNTFVPGQKFMGVEKLNLNGEHNDPSISRAIVSWYIYRQAGVLSSRGAHTELYINDQYRGLYANIEHLDEEFLQIRFNSNDGNLYKCLWPANLTYRGDAAENYRDYYSDDRQVYELKRNVEENDFSDLANFISILNNTDPSLFQEKLEPCFNVNSYLKNQAVEVLIGHWDGYAYNQNNYYLYHNEGSDKLEFIPYDPDNTLGVDWVGRDWTSRDIYSWAQNGGDERPLYKKILANNVYRDRYSFYLNEILKTTFNSTHLDLFLDGLIDRAKGSVEGDTFMTLDWEYDYDSFLNSLDEAAGGHVDYGIKPYITARYNNAQSQLDLNEIDPIITLMYVNQPKLGSSARIQFLLEDEEDLPDYKVWFSSGGAFVEGSTTYVEENLYQSTSPGLTSPGILRFYIEAKDVNNNVSRDPYSGSYEISYGGAISSADNNLRAEDFKLYPNPATGYFVVSGEQSGAPFYYRIIDASGRLCQQGRSYFKHPISLNAALCSGLYFVELNAGSDEFQPSIIKLIIRK